LCSRRVFVLIYFYQEIVLSFRGIMASASNDKGKRPLEEVHEDPKLKEGQMTGGSSAKDPTFVGSIKAGRAFSPNMQGPTLPVLDLIFLPPVEEGLLVTDELCA
jgi:hypothetical protein